MKEEKAERSTGRSAESGLQRRQAAFLQCSAGDKGRGKQEAARRPEAVLDCGAVAAVLKGQLPSAELLALN